MSDLRIALISEGPTDLIVIEAALKAILQRPFYLQLLQPEPTRPDLGAGWGGVFKWCRSFQSGGYATLMADPKLELFDVIVLHLDADVAHTHYADYGGVFAAAAEGLSVLPCAQPCPPAADTVMQLRAVVLDWLGLSALGPQAVLCIPSKASEAWLAAAVLPESHPLHAHIECNLNLEVALSQLPKVQRIRKNQREYRSYEQTITRAWPQVCLLCEQAETFQRDIRVLDFGGTR